MLGFILFALIALLLLMAVGFAVAMQVEIAKDNKLERVRNAKIIAHYTKLQGEMN